MKKVIPSEPARATLQNGTVAVEGALTFDTVPDVLEQSTGWIAADEPKTVDLRGVTRADSAGLALLVEWLRLAREKGKGLKFVNVPEQLRSLIRVNHLEQALGVNNHN